MSNLELLDIYDENMNFLGISKREDAHKWGLWHFTFQCFIIQSIGEEKYLLFQKRQKDKQTYPNYFDVTAAGHLVTGEKVEDGLRELEEELGLRLSIEDLNGVGIIKQRLKGENFIDNEFCHVFIYECKQPLLEYKLQREELQGLFRLKLEDFKELLYEKKVDIELQGVIFNELGGLEDYSVIAKLIDFVPHGIDYYERIIDFIKKTY